MLVNEIGDEGDCISIPPSDPIELPKINTESKRAILLLGEENWHPNWLV